MQLQGHCSQLSSPHTKDHHASQQGRHRCKLPLRPAHLQQLVRGAPSPECCSGRTRTAALHSASHGGVNWGHHTSVSTKPHTGTANTAPSSALAAPAPSLYAAIPHSPASQHTFRTWAVQGGYDNGHGGSSDSSLGRWGQFSQQSAGANSTSTATVPVNFKVQYSARFGQSLCMVGNSQHLGSWDAAQAFPMRWSTGDVWTSELQLPAGAQLEYKYLVKDNSGSIVRWQDGMNLSLKVPTSARRPGHHGAPPATVMDTWCMTDRKLSGFAESEPAPSTANATQNQRASAVHNAAANGAAGASAAVVAGRPSADANGASAWAAETEGSIGQGAAASVGTGRMSGGGLAELEQLAQLDSAGKLASRRRSGGRRRASGGRRRSGIDTGLAPSSGDAHVTSHHSVSTATHSAGSVNVSADHRHAANHSMHVAGTSQLPAQTWDASNSSSGSHQNGNSGNGAPTAFLPAAVAAAAAAMSAALAAVRGLQGIVSSDAAEGKAGGNGHRSDPGGNGHRRDVARAMRGLQGLMATEQEGQSGSLAAELANGNGTNSNSTIQSAGSAHSNIMHHDTDRTLRAEAERSNGFAHWQKQSPEEEVSSSTFDHALHDLQGVVGRRRIEQQHVEMDTPAFAAYSPYSTAGNARTSTSTHAAADDAADICPPSHALGLYANERQYGEHGRAITTYAASNWPAPKIQTLDRGAAREVYSQLHDVITLSTSLRPPPRPSRRSSPLSYAPNWASAATASFATAAGSATSAMAGNRGGGVATATTTASAFGSALAGFPGATNPGSAASSRAGVLSSADIASLDSDAAFDAALAMDRQIAALATKLYTGHDRMLGASPSAAL